MDIDGKFFKVKGGLLSGWRLTNLLGSWINYLINNKVLKKYLPEQLVTMGDDTKAYLVGGGEINLDIIIDEYLALGMEIEKKKNYLSRT